jgi:hypothetical protein
MMFCIGWIFPNRQRRPMTTETINLFAVGLFIFGSICTAYVLFLIMYYVTLRVEEAHERWIDRRELRKQMKKLKGDK